MVDEPESGPHAPLYRAAGDTAAQPQRYGPRLCRAVLLVTIGAALHMPLPDGGPTPLVTPLPFAELDTLGHGRPLLLHQTLVFAPRWADRSVSRPRTVLDVARAAARAVFLPDRALAQKGPPQLPGYARSSAAPPESSAAAELDSTSVTASSPPPDAEPSPPGSLNAAVQPAALVVVDHPPAPTPAPTVAASEAPVPPGTDSRTSEEVLVRRLIDEYTGALERLDVGAAKAAWPTVDGKALKRAFGQLTAQRLTLQTCGITISGSTANARCHGSATYQPRIGSRSMQIASREWRFDLSKQDADWRIVNTLVR